MQVVEATARYRIDFSGLFQVLRGLEKAESGLGLVVELVAIGAFEAEVTKALTDAGDGIDGVETTEFDGDLFAGGDEDELTAFGVGGDERLDDALVVGGTFGGDAIDDEGVFLAFAGFAEHHKLDFDFGRDAAADELMRAVGALMNFFDADFRNEDFVARHENIGGFCGAL